MGNAAGASVANDDPQETCRNAASSRMEGIWATCRPLVLDDSSYDELLDDWMVSYPGTELISSAT
jgi:hypothetical protein